MSDYALPAVDQHVSIMGRNGSGKTYMGAWLLSLSDLDKRPHIIFDTKADELLNSIERAEELHLNGKFPKHPGLYITHPLPGKNNEIPFENFLWKAWSQENCRLYFDEAYMAPDMEAYPAILTQGRSRHVSTINLTQRPAYISRFVFTESTHYSIFHLNDKDDRKKIHRFVPQDKGLNIEQRLPKYHSYWYDVNQDEIFLMHPVEDSDTILSRFHDKLKPKRRSLFGF